jgi:hypothetical protein
MQKIAALKADMDSVEASMIAWENLTEKEIEPVTTTGALNNCYPPMKNSNSPDCNNGQNNNIGPKTPT